MKAKDEGQVIQEDSSEPSHYAMIPKMAMLDLDPYELTLYCHYKMTASENGKCWKSNRTLATESGMSEGRMKTARKILVDKGLITLTYTPDETGNINSPPTITIINVWSENRSRYAKKDAPPHHLVTPPVSPHDPPPSPGDPKESVLKKSEKKNAPRKRSERPRDLFYDAIAAVFNLTASGQIVCIREMMLGRSKRGTWQDCNFDPPVTDAQEITDFGVYMRGRIKDINREREKNGDLTRIMDISAPVTIQRWFYDFRTARDAEHPVKAAGPTEAELNMKSPGQKYDADFERWQKEKQGEPTT